MDTTCVFSGANRSHRGKSHVGHLALHRHACCPGAEHHHHEFIGVSDSDRSLLRAAVPDPGGVVGVVFHTASKWSYENRQGYIGQQRREDAALGSTGDAVATRRIRRAHRFQKRLDQPQYAFCRDAATDPDPSGRCSRSRRNTRPMSASNTHPYPRWALKRIRLDRVLGASARPKPYCAEKSARRSVTAPTSARPARHDRQWSGYPACEPCRLPWESRPAAPGRDKRAGLKCTRCSSRNPSARRRILNFERTVADPSPPLGPRFSRTRSHAVTRNTGSARGFKHIIKPTTTIGGRPTMQTWLAYSVPVVTPPTGRYSAAPIFTGASSDIALLRCRPTAVLSHVTASRPRSTTTASAPTRGYRWAMTPNRHTRAGM